MSTDAASKPGHDGDKPGFVRAFSLWNPHATLAVLGEKKWETRKRQTHVRGRIAIHAALTREWEWMAMIQPFLDVLRSRGADDLCYGSILGTVELTDCKPVEAVRGYIPHSEYSFGNYDDGRWAWKLENPVRFSEPVKAIGRQGFFWVPEEILAQAA